MRHARSLVGCLLKAQLERLSHEFFLAHVGRSANFVLEQAVVQQVLLDYTLVLGIVFFLEGQVEQGLFSNLKFVETGAGGLQERPPSQDRVGISSDVKPCGWVLQIRAMNAMHDKRVDLRGMMHKSPFGIVVNHRRRILGLE